MIKVHADRLIPLVQQIFSRAGCHAPEDAQIARRLVESNLVGHDSHGVIRVAYYIDWLKKDMVRANQKVQTVFETDTLAVLDGQRGFGQSVGEQALDIAIEWKGAGVDETVKAGTALADTAMQEFADQSVFVRTAISGVAKEGVIAAALTAVMILLFIVRPVMRAFLPPQVPPADPNAGLLMGPDGKPILGPDGKPMDAAMVAAVAAAAVAGGALPGQEGAKSEDSETEDGLEEGMIQIGEGETLEEIKARLKPKKSAISVDMLDTANTYDDKVAVIRMLVTEDSKRVASVLKNMMKQ